MLILPTMEFRSIIRAPIPHAHPMQGLNNEFPCYVVNSNPSPIAHRTTVTLGHTVYFFSFQGVRCPAAAPSTNARPISPPPPIITRCHHPTPKRVISAAEHPSKEQGKGLD
jgi:hypothetical protein